MNNNVSAVNPNFGIRPKVNLEAVEKPFKDKAEQTFNQEGKSNKLRNTMYALAVLALGGLAYGIYANQAGQKSSEPTIEDVSKMTTEEAVEMLNNLTYQMSENRRQINEQFKEMIENLKETDNTSGKM